MTLSLPDFDNCKILVAGDLMLDRYWTGSTNRISPEAPVPVVKVGSDDDRLGGAANVALNLASLGCNVSLHGITGNDATAAKLTQLAEEAGLGCFFDQNPDVTTITKLRVISRHQQLIRMDFEDSYAALNKSVLLRDFETNLDSCSAVVLSDYGKGSLSECQKMIQMVRAKNIPVLVDPKGTDFERYQGATLVTPNLSEFELVVGHCESDQELLSKGDSLRKKFAWRALLITLGERGMALIEEGQAPLLVPTQARDVFDVTGAGDTVIATLAASIGAGTDLALATRIANLAAGIVVGKLGTATTSLDELMTEINQNHIATHKAVVTENELLELVARAKAAGERIVMTNGCFDLLHPGHLSYLQEAATEGDRLIVAVNTDDSVSALKGPTRPINSESDRMQMLAALSCVDWVCSFSEETPRRLIAEVLPDILIKGGDYQATDVAGYEEVTAAGGKVKILDFLEGYSSSNLIEKIKKS